MLGHVCKHEKNPAARIILLITLIHIYHRELIELLPSADIERYLYWFDQLKLPCLSFLASSTVSVSEQIVQCDTSHPTYDAKWIPLVIDHILRILGFQDVIGGVESTMCQLSKTGMWNPSVHIESTDQQHQEIKYCMLISKRLGIPRDVATELVNRWICAPGTVGPVERPTKRRKQK